jgi:hypothetical protein
MKKFTGIFLVFIMMNCIVFAQNDGNIILKGGEKFIVESKTTAVTTQNLMGQSMESNIDMSSFYNLEVKNAKENGYNLNNTFTKMLLNMNAMGQDINFDSDKKEDMNGEIGSNLKNILNKPQDVLMNRSGKIILDKKTDTSSRDDMANPIMLMMKQFVSNPAEGGYGASLAFVNIPKKSAVGYNWIDSSSDNGIKKSTTYTITQIKGTEATINISGLLNTDITTEMQGMKITGKSTGTLKGNEIVNLSTGVIKEANTTLESAGTMEVMGQEVPMTTKVISTTTVKSLQ